MFALSDGGGEVALGVVAVPDRGDAPVVDHQDGVEVGLECGARVIERAWPGFAAQKQFAADEAAHDGLNWKYHEPESLENASWKLSMLSQLDEAIDASSIRLNETLCAWAGFSVNYAAEVRSFLEAVRVTGSMTVGEQR